MLNRQMVINVTANALVRFGERTLDDVAFGVVALIRRAKGEDAEVPTKREVQNALRAMQRAGEVKCSRYRGAGIGINGKYLWMLI